jgi:hypothetical protein
MLVAVILPDVTVTVAGFKLAVTPCGTPLRLNATAPLNPSTDCTRRIENVELPPKGNAIANPDGNSRKAGTTVKFTVADPHPAGSAVLHAVTVSVGTAGGLGAVYKPVGPIVPEPADHVTDVSEAPVTVAANCCVWPAARVPLDGLTATIGVTFTAIGIVMIRFPLVPTIVTVEAPIAAELEALRVSTEVEVITGRTLTEAGLKLAVTPVGKPLAVSVTAPVNDKTDCRCKAQVALPPTGNTGGAAQFVVEILKSGIAVMVTVAVPQMEGLITLQATTVAEVVPPSGPGAVNKPLELTEPTPPICPQVTAVSLLPCTAAENCWVCP